MLQRRPNRTIPRSRSMALGGVLAALAVVGGGTLAVVNAPTDVEAGDIRLAQNETQDETRDETQDGARTGAQQMPLGTPVDLDLEPVVARAAGGTIPEGTTVQVTGLPDGLTQNGWVISGTPTRAGEYDVLVTVSNSGVARSQKVTIEVTDEGGDASTPAVPTDPSTDRDPSGTTAPSDTTPSDQGGPSGEVEPTLSATPGDRGRAGATGGTETAAGGGIDSDDGEGDTGVSPDLCAALAGGQADASSLARLLTGSGDDGDDGDTASAGLVTVLVNAVVGLLPSVLGDGGVLEGLGSAGQLLCSLSPSEPGGQDGAAVTDGAGAVDGAAATADLTAALPGEGRDATVSPALLGLLTAGAGSLGE